MKYMGLAEFDTESATWESAFPEGVVRLTIPKRLSSQSLAELRELLDLVVRQLVRRAVESPKAVDVVARGSASEADPPTRA